MDKVSWENMKQTFKKYLSMLTEGGNVRIQGKSKELHAERVDLSKISREELVSIMRQLFHALNAKYKAIYKEALWVDDTIDSGEAFNGSSELLFRKNITDSEFLSAKSSVGDIDITVDQDKLENVRNFLKKIKNELVLSQRGSNDLTVKFLGHNKENQIDYRKEGKQFNSLFAITYNGKKQNIQVDFEFSEYKEGRPTKWTKFSHSSEWEDLKEGIKGVHHKYLVRALVGTAITRNDIVVMQLSATPDNPNLTASYKNKLHIGLYKFSVGRGARLALKQQFLPDGKPWQYQGRLVYKELETEDSKYEKDPVKILKLVFGNKAKSNKIESFVGLLELMKSLEQDDVKRVINRLVDLYWGEDGQQLERNNPNLDKEIKDIGFKKVMEAFPWYKNKSLKGIEADFYKNYKMT